MMNKAKLLKMYMDGVPVKEIASTLGCTTKTVYKITATHGLHRKRGTSKPQLIPKKKPKYVAPEPMYREIPTHLPVVNVDEKHKSQIDELKRYRATHEKPWYLK